MPRRFGIGAAGTRCKGSHDEALVRDPGTLLMIASGNNTLGFGGFMGSCEGPVVLLRYLVHLCMDAVLAKDRAFWPDFIRNGRTTVAHCDPKCPLRERIIDFRERNHLLCRSPRQFCRVSGKNRKQTKCLAGSYVVTYAYAYGLESNTTARVMSGTSANSLRKIMECKLNFIGLADNGPEIALFWWFMLMKSVEINVYRDLFYLLTGTLMADPFICRQIPGMAQIHGHHRAYL